MTPRTRRLLGGIALLVVLLYIGRWTVSFVTERWWAATISAAAVQAVTRWQLLGLGLDVVAVLIASGWFALQALLVARAVATVSVTRRIGDLEFRDAIPTRFLWIAGISTGVLLGLITGAGARAWRGPVALAWQGVHYGVTDPLLGEDVGVFVAQLPLWNLAHDFAITLVVLGLVVVAMLYGSIGGITRGRGVLVVHPDARRHLGALLMLCAAVVGVGYLLEPHRLAGSADPLLGAGAVVVRMRVALVMAGVAFGVSLLCFFWAQQGRHALLLSGWGVLIVAALSERIVIPILASDATPPAVTAAEVRQLEALAWGLREQPSQVSADTVPNPTTIWDEAILARWLEADGRTLLGAAPGQLPTNGALKPGWLLVTTSTDDHRRVDVLGVAEGMVAIDGGPALVHPQNSSDSTAPLLSLADPRLRPDGEPWRTSATGVPLGGPVRRVVLAWARQAWRMLSPGAARAVDWHLDPVERAAAILPMAHWSQPTPSLVGGRLSWVVQGMLPLQIAPRSTRARWWGSQVAGVVPAFVATMDAVSGAVRVYVDPGADSLGASWGRFAPGLIAPAALLPAEVRADLQYPAGWFAAQLAVLEGPEWTLGRRPGRETADGPPETPLVTWRSPSEVQRIAVYEDPARRVVSAIVTAGRINGVPTLHVERITGTAVFNGRELERDWSRIPTLAHLRDSVLAADDTFLVSSPRWRSSGGELVAWQPMFAVPSRSHPSLLGIGGAVGDRVAGARVPTELWGQLLGLPGSTGGTSAGPTDARRLAAAQGWLRLADSALARRDLTAFGRAFEELRKLLDRPLH